MMTFVRLASLLGLAAAGACGSASESPDGATADAATIDSATAADASCTTLACTTAKYSLLVADQDGTNVRVIRTSSSQDMTHPRVSSDRTWVAYTTYNDVNADGCATQDQGYLNTEIRAVQLTGDGDKVVVDSVAGALTSNNYWIGATNEFTYLSGPPTDLRFQRATVDASMNVISGPTEIPVVETIIPLDPSTTSGRTRSSIPGCTTRAAAS